MLGLDTVLIIILSLPIPLTYALSPNGTPYWLFALYFLFLILYVVLDRKIIPVAESHVLRYKYWLTWLVILLVIGCVYGTSIATRIGVAPEFGVHDIILQLESAMRFLLEGKNPYAVTYIGTPMEKWLYAEFNKQAVNPALYHFVMPPWYLLFPFLFYIPSISFFGFFDGRLPLVFTFFGTLVTFCLWEKNLLKRIYLLIVSAFNPVVFKYLLEGRSDHFAFFWLVVSIFLLQKRRYVLSAIFFALGMLSKQTIWLALPFYVVYLYWSAHQSPKSWVGPLVVLVALFVGLQAPFIAWDARAYFDSIVGFLQGTTAVSYPISGYGFGMVLSQLGLVRDLHGYYPFVLWQALIGLPVFMALFVWFRKKQTASAFFIAYGLFLFVFWYFSRYFNNSHLGYISMLLSTGYLLDLDV